VAGAWVWSTVLPQCGSVLRRALSSAWAAGLRTAHRGGGGQRWAGRGGAAHAGRACLHCIPCCALDQRGCAIRASSPPPPCPVCAAGGPRGHCFVNATGFEVQVDETTGAEQECQVSRGGRAGACCDTASRERGGMQGCVDTCSRWVGDGRTCPSGRAFRK